MLKQLPTFLFASTTILLLSASSVFANGEDVHDEVQEVVTRTLEDTIRANSIKVVVIASILILVSVALTILFKHLGEGLKKFLFAGIVIPTLLVTFYMVGSTLYLNFTSSTGGPVHWHADLEIWSCGQELDLVDPRGLSNKIGTATFHEHNDGRIHVEGVVTNPEEASLGKFFGFVGGHLTADEMRIPTNDGLIVRRSGDLCADGTEGILQVFVYKTQDNIFTQMKLDDPASYILSPESAVPPGDCIIVEFGTEKERTDKLCGSYEVQQKLDKIRPSPEQTIEPSVETTDLDIPISTPSSEPDHHEEEVAPHGH